MSCECSDARLKTPEELALESLARIAARNPPQKLIRFPEVFSRICPLLAMKKAEAWKTLRILKEQGHIEIVPFRGVRVVSGENK